IGEPRPFLLGSCPRQRLSRSFEVAGVRIEGRLGDDPLLEQLGLPIVVLLRQFELRIGLFGSCRRLVERGLELPHVLLGFRERGLLLLDYVFKGLRVDAKQHLPFLERGVLLHWHFDHPTPHGRQYGRHREIDAGILRKRMIVVHDQQQQRDADDSAQRRGRQRPLVDRYPENLEGYVADRNVDQDQQEFHYRAPVLWLFSSSATRRRRSSSSLDLSAAPSPSAAD